MEMIIIIVFITLVAIYQLPHSYYEQIYLLDKTLSMRSVKANTCKYLSKISHLSQSNFSVFPYLKYIQ